MLLISFFSLSWDCEEIYKVLKSTYCAIVWLIRSFAPLISRCCHRRGFLRVLNVCSAANLKTEDIVNERKDNIVLLCFAKFAALLLQILCNCRVFLIKNEIKLDDVRHLEQKVGKVENETRDNNNSTKRERCFFVLSRAWDKENSSESPRGIEPQSFGFRAPML